MQGRYTRGRSACRHGQRRSRNERFPRQEQSVLAGKVRPRITAVSGLVKSKTGFRVRRCIRLAGPGVERTVGRIIGECANCIGREVAGDKCPAHSIAR